MVEADKPVAHTDCKICGTIGNYASAEQKGGHAEDDTSLPDARSNLVIVKDFKPKSYDRKLQLLQCSACQAYYLYELDYEFYVNGTEDYEYLTRLTNEQAAEELKKPVIG